MKILVTGANGLLGHHIVNELLERDVKVRIIIRTNAQVYFDLNRVEVFVGNFTDFDTLKRAASGCDAIIHAAAVTATNLLHYKDYEIINVTGSENVIKVTDELNIDKLVLISSSNTIGYGNAEMPADENSPMELPFTDSLYAQSKSEAEKLFVEFSKKQEKHVVILNSCFLIGGFDTKNSSGRLVKMGYRKPILFVPKGGKNFVAASKVAEAACNAISLDENGEKHLVCGENLSFKEYFEKQKTIGNYRQKIFEIPDWILRTVGFAGDILRKLGIRTELCSVNIRQLLVREYYSGKKGDEALKLNEHHLENAISQAIEWIELKK